MNKHHDQANQPWPGGLKLVLLLFDRAEKKNPKQKKKQNKQISLIHFLFLWGCAAFSEAAAPNKRNGDIVVKQQQQQQQAVVRTATGWHLAGHKTMGSFQVAHFASTRRGGCYLLPVRNVQTTWKICDATLRQKYKNLERFKLNFLNDCISISKMYILHLCTILNETHMYREDTPVNRDELKLMPSYLMRCNVFHNGAWEKSVSSGVHSGNRKQIPTGQQDSGFVITQWWDEHHYCFNMIMIKNRTVT